MEKGIKLEQLKDGVKNQRKKNTEKETSNPTVRKRDMKVIKKK